MKQPTKTIRITGKYSILSGAELTAYLDKLELMVELLVVIFNTKGITMKPNSEAHKYYVKHKVEEKMKEFEVKFLAN